MQILQRSSRSIIRNGREFDFLGFEVDRVTFQGNRTAIHALSVGQLTREARIPRGGVRFAVVDLEIAGGSGKKTKKNLDFR